MCMNPKYCNKQLKSVTKLHSTMFCRFEKDENFLTILL